MNGQTRTNIKPGVTVLIVLKQDQRTGKLTKGVVKDILTKSPNHPHGIKSPLGGWAGGAREGDRRAAMKKYFIYFIVSAILLSACGKSAAKISHRHADSANCCYPIHADDHSHASNCSAYSYARLYFVPAHASGY